MASCKENRRARLDVCAGCGPVSREPVYRDVLCDSCATAKRRGTPLCRCGGVMVLRWEGRRYCARCPQDWLVPIYLVCRETRRERVAWSPRSRYEALASAVGLDPRVLETMLPYFTEKFGNAASRNHAFGWAAEEAVENARKQIAKLIKADPKEIVFMSGATESDNLAIKGVLDMYKEKGDHIITSSTEHRAVLDTVKSLEGRGKASATYLPVDKFGVVNPEDVRKAITEQTILISVMLANNEIGTINPVKEIGKIAKEKGILFHCDATQGVCSGAG